MDVGTAETLDEIQESKPRRSRNTIGGPGSPSGGGGRRESGGGGGDGPDDDGENSQTTTGFVPDKSRVLTVFVLAVVMMTFGGLMAAYVVVATNKALEWNPFELPVQVWISTVMILASSVTYHIGKLAVDAGDRMRAKKWFVVTTILGAAFISSQLLVWLELTARGLYMRGNPYGGFFYILTAVHALHVLGGVIALGSILLRVWSPTPSEQQLLRERTLAQVVGWYWHAIGALWIALFLLLGFWK